MTYINSEKEKKTVYSICFNSILNIFNTNEFITVFMFLIFYMYSSCLTVPKQPLRGVLENMKCCYKEGKILEKYVWRSCFLKAAGLQLYELLHRYFSPILLKLQVVREEKNFFLTNWNRKITNKSCAVLGDGTLIFRPDINLSVLC